MSNTIKNIYQDSSHAEYLIISCDDSSQRRSDVSTIADGSCNLFRS